MSQIKTAVSGLAEQYRTREEVFEAFKREYNIRPATRS
jgi:prefoldin subunit 2